MMSNLDQHNLANSRCGVPLIAELLHVCLSHPEPESLDWALIWLALLHGLEDLAPAMETTPTPLKLTQNQAVALYAAMHLAGNPAQNSLPLHTLLAEGMSDGEKPGEAIAIWQVMNRAIKCTQGHPHAELIRQASLLHFTDPSALLEDWLGQLDAFMAAGMPFAALLRLSILCRNMQDLPENWQLRLADAITRIGDLADAIPLYRFWMVACQVAPAWDFACIRAADLALRFEDFTIADHLLERLERTHIQNAWFYDVKARCRYGYGDLRSAAHLWSVGLSKVAPSSPERQVFQDRMHSALRGKFGLGEASRLARSGQLEAALHLLQILILNDPGFTSYYKFLLSIQENLKKGEWLPIQPKPETLSVESVIVRFRSLWMEKEDPIQPGDEEEQIRAAIQQAATFLSRCEESLALWRSGPR